MTLDSSTARGECVLVVSVFMFNSLALRITSNACLANFHIKVKAISNLSNQHSGTFK